MIDCEGISFIMDQMPPPAFNPHLQRVLKSFQTAAMRSLNGPSNYVAAWSECKLSPVELDEYRKALARSIKKAGTEFKGLEFDPLMQQPPPFPIQQMPLLIPMDNSRSEKAETDLETEKIACFGVGGEKRLCLPQILNTVLRDFSLQQINSVCDDLHIFCSRCNPEQLETLKLSGVLPLSAPSCGLITKTDAERLCNALIHRNPEKSMDPPSQNSFKVYHECFGKCKGLFSPDQYKSSDALCIQCIDCHGMFSPQKFVCHSHKSLENRTCHWGFDSENWRYYLLLGEDQENVEKLQDVLETEKLKFDTNRKFKRKIKESGDDKLCCKRLKGDAEQMRISAFHPWCPATKDGKLLPAPPIVMQEGAGGKFLPSYLRTGPPILLNPERAVPKFEDGDEPQFAPNVALAPASKQQKNAANKSDDCKEDIDTGWDASDAESVCGSSPLIFSPKNFGSEFSYIDIVDRQFVILQQALDGKVNDHKACIDHFQQLAMWNLQAYRDLLSSKKSLEKEIEVLRLLTRSGTPPQKPLVMSDESTETSFDNEENNNIEKHQETKKCRRTESPATTDDSWSPPRTSPKGTQGDEAHG